MTAIHRRAAIEKLDHALEHCDARASAAERNKDLDELDAYLHAGNLLYDLLHRVKEEGDK